MKENAKIKKIYATLKNNDRFKKILFIFVCVFFFLYTFSLPAFSGRVKFNILAYFFMAGLIVSTILYCLLYSNFKINKYLFIMPLFIIWAFFGTAIYSHDFRNLLTIVLLTLTMFVFYFSFHTIGKTKLIILLIIWALICFSFYFLFIYWKDLLNINSFSGEKFRLGSYFDNVNQIASYMSTGIALTLYVSLFSKKKWNFLYLIPTILFVIIGLATGSKKFIIVTVVTVLLLLYFKFKKHKFIFLLVLLIFITAVIIFLNLPIMSGVSKRLIDSILTFSGQGGSTSTVQRLLWQINACYLGFKRIIFGYGCNGFAMISGIGTYSHANYSEIICNFGVIGFVIFYSCLFFAFYHTLRKKRGVNILNFVFISIYLIYSFTKVFYFDKDFYLLVALMYFLIDTSENKESFVRYKVSKANNDYLEVMV